MRCEGQIGRFWLTHLEFPRALRSLSYVDEKCSGVENEFWVELEGIKMAFNYPVKLHWLAIYLLVAGFRVVDVAKFSFVHFGILPD